MDAFDEPVAPGHDFNSGKPKYIIKKQKIIPKTKPPMMKKLGKLLNAKLSAINLSSLNKSRS